MYGNKMAYETKNFIDIINQFKQELRSQIKRLAKVTQGTTILKKEMIQSQHQASSQSLNDTSTVAFHSSKHSH